MFDTGLRGLRASGYGVAGVANAFFPSLINIALTAKFGKTSLRKTI